MGFAQLFAHRPGGLQFAPRMDEERPESGLDWKATAECVIPMHTKRTTRLWRRVESPKSQLLSGASKALTSEGPTVTKASPLKLGIGLPP